MFFFAHLFLLALSRSSIPSESASSQARTSRKAWAVSACQIFSLYPGVGPNCGSFVSPSLKRHVKSKVRPCSRESLSDLQGSVIDPGQCEVSHPSLRSVTSRGPSAPDGRCDGSVAPSRGRLSTSAKELLALTGLIPRHLVRLPENIERSPVVGSGYAGCAEVVERSLLGLYSVPSRQIA